MKKEIYKYLKITIRTPKGQAESCMKTQRQALLGFSKAKKIKEEKLVNNEKFYWIVPTTSEKDLMAMHKRLVRGELFIKQFYKTLMKLLNRANKLANKFRKGAKWIRKSIIKKIHSNYRQGDDSEGMISYIKNMSDDEIKDFIKINDREEMLKLLSGELITTEIKEP